MGALDLVMRWIHIGSIVVLVGGAFFKRFVLIPSSDQLTEGDHQLLKQAILSRWKVIVHTLIATILISGFYALVMKIQSKPPLYHALFGVKLLLALWVFFVASALVGRSAGLEPMRRNLRFWLGLNLAIAAAIIMISGVLRSIPDKSTATVGKSIPAANAGAKQKG